MCFVSGYCEAHFDSFASLCMNIAGDSPMYSLFRRNSDTVKCPFKGPFTFSYSKGGTGSVCSYPKSYMDGCEDGHRLQLHFQACTDVQGSESTAEELQCIASWKEGSKKYLVAELNREHMYSDESKFKCFVYERVGKGEEGKAVRMAQSESATCSGLWSAHEGFRTFDMEPGRYYPTITRDLVTICPVHTVDAQNLTLDQKQFFLANRVFWFTVY